jgi:hypothetical protein
MDVEHQKNVVFNYLIFKIIVLIPKYHFGNKTNRNGLKHFYSRKTQFLE